MRAAVLEAWAAAVSMFRIIARGGSSFSSSDMSESGGVGLPTWAIDTKFMFRLAISWLRFSTYSVCASARRRCHVLALVLSAELRDDAVSVVADLAEVVAMRIRERLAALRSATIDFNDGG